MDFPTNLKRAMVLTVLITVVLLIGWELYWRSQHYEITYNDDNATWANARKKITSRHDETVIIGSSRVKFDIDLPTFKQKSGHDVVQLAVEGTSPLPILHHLANDSDFAGTLLVGVTEGLFFSISPRAVMEVNSRLKYYQTWSLAQRGSFKIGQALESKFVFLDQERFSLNPLIKRLPIPNRDGVWVFPNFPLTFASTDINRQTKMTPMFVNDTTEIAKMRKVWMQLGLTNRKKGVTGDTLTNILKAVKTSTDKIKERGGKVVFVRCPSTGPVWQAEQIAFPRNEFWDALLRFTECDGIHFKDNPAIENYNCPEWSHLTPADAIPFTESLVDILNKKNAFIANKK